jgi:hypothetical protein
MVSKNVSSFRSTDSLNNESASCSSRKSNDLTLVLLLKLVLAVEGTRS